MDTKINLCDDCDNCFGDCDPGEIEFGDGLGNDNVISCETHREYIQEEIRWEDRKRNEKIQSRSNKENINRRLDSI